MQKTLYLGLELPPHLTKENIVHCPLIRIVPKNAADPTIVSALKNFKAYTHLIFTSKSAVSTFFDLIPWFKISLKDIHGKTIIVIGQRTAEKLRENKILPTTISKEETAEGIIKELKSEELKKSHFLLPQSSLARPILTDWCKQHGIPCTACPIYDTLPNIPKALPDLTLFDQIIFTSPSVVDAFIQAYGHIPEEKKLTCIGPITKSHLLQHKTQFRGRVRGRA